MSLLSSFAFLSCGVHKMLPKGAVLSKVERMEIENHQGSNIEYISSPLTDFPVIPFQIFGIAYDLDIVIVTKYPDVDMHEFAKLSFPETSDGRVERSIWIAKESENQNLDQYIYSDQPDLPFLFPEIPLEIVQSPISVVDQSDSVNFDFLFQYTNRHGIEISASYFGDTQLKSLKKRNGSTMGHSRNQVLAVLDLPKRNFGNRSRITYDKVEYKVKRILGIKPFRMALQQSQGGLSAVSMDMWVDGESILSRYVKKDVPIEVEWKKKETQDKVMLFQKNELRTIEYEFNRQDNEFRFSSARVRSWNKEEPVIQISVFPSLPDLRRKFKGIFTSRFVIDINDQENLSYGELSCHWAQNDLIIDIRPSAPWWTKERPMRGTIRIEKNKAIAHFKMTKSNIP